MVKSKQRFVTELQVSENPEVWHKVFLSPIVREDGSASGLAGISIDISELKQAQQHLTNLNEAKNSLFATIAHDMRSPLTSLKSLMGILMGQEEMITLEKKKEYYHTVTKQLDDTMNILDNLFQWAQLQRKGIFLDKRTTTIESLLQEAYRGISFRLQDKRIKLETHGENVHKAYVDAHMITSAFRNILTNAVKFTPEGGIVTVSIEDEDETTRVIISDEGIGISKELLPKILNSQDRVSTKGTNNENGTGLGLILTKNFIEQNSGTLSLDSVQGKGTKVTIELPAVRPSH